MDVLHLLIERGVEVNAKAGQDAFVEAARYGHVDVLHLLIGRGMEVNSEVEQEAFVEAARGTAKAEVNSFLWNGRHPKHPTSD